MVHDFLRSAVLRRASSGHGLLKLTGKRFPVKSVIRDVPTLYVYRGWSTRTLTCTYQANTCPRDQNSWNPATGVYSFTTCFPRARSTIFTLVCQDISLSLIGLDLSWGRNQMVGSRSGIWCGFVGFGWGNPIRIQPWQWRFQDSQLVEYKRHWTEGVITQSRY